MLYYLLQHYGEKEKITVVSEIKFCSRQDCVIHWVLRVMSKVFEIYKSCMNTDDLKRNTLITVFEKISK